MRVLRYGNLAPHRLADTWTRGISAYEYAIFLQTLFDQVTIKIAIRDQTTGQLITYHYIWKDELDCVYDAAMYGSEDEDDDGKGEHGQGKHDGNHRVPPSSPHRALAQQHIKDALEEGSSARKIQATHRAKSGRLKALQRHASATAIAGSMMKWWSKKTGHSPASPGTPGRPGNLQPWALREGVRASISEGESPPTFPRLEKRLSSSRSLACSPQSPARPGLKKKHTSQLSYKSLVNQSADSLRKMPPLAPRLDGFSLSDFPLRLGMELDHQPQARPQSSDSQLEDSALYRPLSPLAAGDATLKAKEASLAGLTEEEKLEYWALMKKMPRDHLVFADKVSAEERLLFGRMSEQERDAYMSMSLEERAWYLSGARDQRAVHLAAHVISKLRRTLSPPLRMIFDGLREVEQVRLTCMQRDEVLNHLAGHFMDSITSRNVSSNGDAGKVGYADDEEVGIERLPASLRRRKRIATSGFPALRIGVEEAAKRNRGPPSSPRRASPRLANATDYDSPDYTQASPRLGQTASGVRLASAVAYGRGEAETSLAPAGKILENSSRQQTGGVAYKTWRQPIDQLVYWQRRPALTSRPSTVTTLPRSPRARRVAGSMGALGWGVHQHYPIAGNTAAPGAPILLPVSPRVRATTASDASPQVHHWQTQLALADTVLHVQTAPAHNIYNAL